MTKNNTKKSNNSVSKPNFDKIFKKVLEETPKQAVEIEKHEFKSEKIKSVVEKTQTSIAEIPDRISKARLSYLESQFKWSKLLWKPTIYEQKSEIEELTPEQMQVLGSQKYIMWLDNPKNKIINDKNRKGNLTKPSEKREKAFKKLQKEWKSRQKNLWTIGLNADLADKAVMESVISYYIDKNIEGMLTNKEFAGKKVVERLKTSMWYAEPQGETYSFSKGILKSVGQVNAFAIKTMWISRNDRLNLQSILDVLYEWWYEKQVKKLENLIEKREIEMHDFKVNYLWLKRMYAKAKITAEIAEKYGRKLKKSHQAELNRIRVMFSKWKTQFEWQDLAYLSDNFWVNKEIYKFYIGVLNDYFMKARKVRVK